MIKQERLQITIPSENKWHTEDIETKAAEMGMTKNELTFMAIDFFMNFDIDIYERLKAESNGSHLPLWLYTQNKIVKEMAQTRVEIELGGNTSKLVDEFIMVKEPEGTRVVTGIELYHQLRKLYEIGYKQK